MGNRARKRLRESRLEHFGAIIQLTTPQSLVFVDREKATALGLGSGHNVWAGEQPSAAPLEQRLSAPLEVHMQLTNRCSVGCRTCYTGATPHGLQQEYTLSDWKKTLRELADMGVFHVALGGGESADLPGLPEIAAYARSVGIVPNLTTSGLSGLDKVIEAAPHLERINFSLDGVGSTYKKVRGAGDFARVDYAIRQLRHFKKRIGLNVVVTRHNFAQLGDIFRYARSRKLMDVELLRLKPAGRGKAVYKSLACTEQQHFEFFPRVLRLARKFRLRVRVDCSYVPMIACHGASPRTLAKLSVYGCAAGDMLAAVKSDGSVSGCSFAPADSRKAKATDIRSYWDAAEAFPTFRKWRDIGGPCKSCEYLAVCRGGCRAVSRGVTGNVAAPDPECPRVVAFSRREGKTSSRPTLAVIQ